MIDMLYTLTPPKNPVRRDEKWNSNITSDPNSTRLPNVATR